jgi:hypothetical protein
LSLAKAIERNRGTMEKLAIASKELLSPHVAPIGRIDHKVDGISEELREFRSSLFPPPSTDSTHRGRLGKI